MQYKVLYFNIILTFTLCVNITIFVVNWGLKRQNDKIYDPKLKSVSRLKITLGLSFWHQSKLSF